MQSDDDAPIAEPSRRIFARLIDSAFLAVPMWTCGAIGVLTGTSALVRLGFWLGLALGLASFAVDVWLLHHHGQSIGKRLLGLRIVRVDGRRASVLSLVLVRELLYRGVVWIPAVGTLLGLLNALTLFSKRRRTLHDRLAGTIVLDLRDPAPRSF